MRHVLSGLLAATILAAAIAASGQSAASDPLARAAEALGGRSRLLAVRTLTIEGYGQLAAQNGGGNVTTSPDAPMKWTDVNDYVQHIDLANGRMRVRQTQAADFVAATIQRMRGVVSTQALDGDVAFNVDAQGRATRAPAAAARDRRMEMLAHPVTAVRAALDPKSRVSGGRASGGMRLVDVTIPHGDTFTLAVDEGSGLPAWVSWVGPDTNLGDVTYRAHFIGYQPVGGLRMPTAITTTIDFRNVVAWKLHVDRHAVDAAIPDLAAPDAVRNAAPTAPRLPAIEATPLAKGVWFLAGAGNSTLFEFDDHLTLYEAYGSEANAKAIIAKAKSLVPGKPLTELIVSHHHFDHTGGFRAAVAEGLTIVTARGNEAFLREIASRPAKLFPDALGPTPRPVRIRTVDDHLKLKDGSMEIDVYRVMANVHMADALMVHVPRERLLAQGDLFDVGWVGYWWGTSYMDNVRYRKLEVERDVPVHGKVLPLAEVQQHIAKQIRNAQDFCAQVEAARLSMRGCPVKTTVDR